ncbi:hypothetical protein SOCE26_081970 [Sorangium cellulosum]|uniref:Uncharacterized protein n=1 Tax=Sorangium cellulosum TaxID=56 RepID=A0A2L0F5H3_SORCE|nr:hypothetical protein [Sorangium cellulosum]AUX46689.1 hypothetical protein SOCE26_081970 [Sorangium cellulosum]
MRYDRTVLAYHGCDADVADQLLAGTSFRPSENAYDWLGKGIYFWEYGHDRALRFARFQQERGKVKNPTVIGAVLQLGRCFDLMDTRFTLELAVAFNALKQSWDSSTPWPVNRGKTPDEELRFLDCAVLNFYLEQFEATAPFQTVRGAFVEGDVAFSGSRIQRETHIQIAVRDPGCILGVFRPMMDR